MMETKKEIDEVLEDDIWWDDFYFKGQDYANRFKGEKK